MFSEQVCTEVNGKQIHLLCFRLNTPQYAKTPKKKKTRAMPYVWEFESLPQDNFTAYRHQTPSL